MVDVFYYDAFQKTISPEPEGGPLVRHSDYAALEAQLAERAPGPDDETYYSKGKDADWFEKLDNGAFAWELTCVAQDLNDTGLDEPASSWMPVLAMLSGAADRIAALEAQLAERVKVKPLDNATQQKLREALRFAASRSVLSSEDERRILSTLESTPPAPKVTDEMVERGAKKLLLVMPELLRLYPSTAGEVARRDVREVLDVAITAAQEAGKT